MIGAAHSNPVELLRAFAWFRWRVFVNRFKSSARGDRMSELSQILGLLQPIFLFGLFVPGVLASCIGALWLGRWWALQPQPHLEGFPVLAVILLIALLLTILYPLLTLSQATDLPSTRMRLLPVPARLLHGLELASNWLSPVVGPMSAVLCCAALGVLSSGRWILGLVALLVALLYSVILLGLQSCAGMALQWLFLDRRRGQMVSLLTLLFLTTTGVLPAFFESIEIDSGWMLTGLDLVDVFLPPGQATEALTRSLIADWPQVVFSLILLSGEALFLYLLSWWIYGIVQSSSVNSTSSRRELRREPLEIPILEPQVAALVQLELRHVLRSGRGKLGLLLSPLIVPLVGWAILRSGETAEFFESLGLDAGVVLALWAVAFGFLAFQPVVYNLFGSDEAGLNRLLLLPLSESRLARGKMWAAGVLFTVAVSLGWAASLLVARSSNPLVWATIPGIALAAGTVSVPLGLLLSLIFPKKANLDTMREKGNPHPLAGLVGTFAVIPLIGIPGLGLALAAAGARPDLLLIAGVMWMAGCWLVGKLLLKWSIELLGRRREDLHQIVEGR